jgi:thymidylate synthase (FAD)
MHGTFNPNIKVGEKMKIIDQNWKFEQVPQNIHELIERAARTCYKSESKGNPNSFLKGLIISGHHSVLEHTVISVLIDTDRAVTHELCRHRIGVAFSQESQRYVNYKEGIEFIRPFWASEKVLGKWECTLPVRPTKKIEAIFVDNLCIIESDYISLIREGLKPEEARVILPNCTKTSIFITANIREWRHIFDLRCSIRAYPQIRILMRDILKEFKQKFPIFFDDIYPEIV